MIMRADPLPLELSIVVCTHNRAHLLEELLSLLLPQTAGQPVEVIVVDSGSRPADAARVRTMVQGAPGVRLVRIDKPGVSLARNAALASVRAPWMATLDDDEMPTDDWLDKIRSLIHRLPTNCGACGGNVIPRFPTAVAPKLGPRWSGYLSTIDRCGEFDQTADLKMGLGHSVMRVQAAKSVGGFDAELGRTGTLLMSGEDVLIVQRLIDAGWRIWHSDTIRVDHVIPPERLTPAWVRQRAYWEGKTVAQLLKIYEPAILHRKALELACKLGFLAMLTVAVGNKWEMNLRFAYACGFLNGYARGLLGDLGLTRANGTAPYLNLRR